MIYNRQYLVQYIVEIVKILIKFREAKKICTYNLFDTCSLQLDEDRCFINNDGVEILEINNETQSSNSDIPVAVYNTSLFYISSREHPAYEMILNNSDIKKDFNLIEKDCIEESIFQLSTTYSDDILFALHTEVLLQDVINPNIYVSINNPKSTPDDVYMRIHESLTTGIIE